jgi:glycosyltransferase involved in cell wall biosynthesis
MALALAEFHDVTVVTRANNRQAIEHFLCSNKGPNPAFLYLDPPFWFLRLKRSGLLPIQVFYGVWQACVALMLKKEATLGYDIVHQLTFNSFEVPPLAFFCTNSVHIWGPVGGGQTVPLRMLAAFGPFGAILELLRNLRVWLSAKNPLCRLALKRSSLVLFANRETQRILAGCDSDETILMIDVGVDIHRFTPAVGMAKEKKKIILFAGRFDHRKGAIFLLDAFASVAAQYNDVELRLVGDGPLRDKLESRAKSMRLANRVVFTGMINHERMRSEMAAADIFAFPSLRDTSGAVVLEAMATALPIVCFDHQGASVMVPDNCGIRIPPSSPGSAIANLADALLKLIKDDDLTSRMGLAARMHVVKTYHWQAKAAVINHFYLTLTAEKCGPWRSLGRLQGF